MRDACPQTRDLALWASVFSFCDGEQQIVAEASKVKVTPPMS